MTLLDYIIGLFFITTIIHAPKLERYSSISFITKIVLSIEGFCFISFPYYMSYRILEETQWVTDKGTMITICGIFGTIILFPLINHIVEEGKREKMISRILSKEEDRQ